MTGIQPSALLDDEALYASAVEQAESAEWTTLHEMMATLIELTHTTYRQVRANAGAKQDLAPLKWPRPGEKPDGPLVVQATDLAMMLRRGL
jgi:hypothetical protein